MIAILIAILGLLPGVGSAEDWPRWRGPRGDGTWRAPPLAEKWPAEGLSVAWRQKIGGGYAGVTVADGRVFVLDRQTEPAEVERVTAYAADDGRPLWSHSYAVAYGDMAYGNGPRADATHHEGRVYTLGARGHALCLDAATGEPLWTRDTVAELEAKIPEWGLSASPFIYGSLVVLHVGAPGGSFVALDRQTGREVWRASEDPAGYCTPILIDHPSGGPQLICWTPEHIVGIDPREGRVEWTVPYKVTYGVSIATPIYVDGRVFVSGYWEGSKAIQLGPERSQAAIAWEDNTALRGLMSQPVYRDGHVYLLDKRFGLTCFELATGRKLWDDENRLTPRGRNPQATLVWTGDADRVIALNSEGELILATLGPTGCEELARTRIIGPTWAHPAYVGSRVYARDDQELVCVSLPLAKENEAASDTEPSNR